MTEMHGKAKLTAKNGKYTLTLDADVIDASGLADGDELHVVVDAGKVVMSRDELTEPEVNAALERAHRRFGGMLSRLAK